VSILKPSTTPATRRSLTVLAVLVGTTTLIAACSGSSASTNSTTSTSDAGSAPGTAQIAAFDVPASAQCGGKTSTMVPVHYAVTGSTKQLLRVDGRDVPGTEATSASLSVAVHCDPLPHTFVLVAYDAKGRRTALQKLLTTQ
jgi:hypothetical protein